MSKVRWSIIGVLVAVVLAVVVWRVTDVDEGADPLRATLMGIDPDSSEDYVYPVWATDGRTPVKLAGVEGELKLLDPLDRFGTPLVGTTLPGGAGAQPQSVAALPGSADGPWVAVALKSKRVEDDDFETTERPLVWTGQELASEEPARAADPVRLPVDLASNQSNGAVPAIDAAVARLGNQDIAVVTTNQSNDSKEIDLTSFLVCRLDDCRWRSGAVPQNSAVHAVGSTGDGLVAVVNAFPSKGFDVWYADDADLTWRRVGAAPAGMTLQDIQDGDGAATLIWKRGESDKIAIQALRDGKLRNPVRPTPIKGEFVGVNTALEVDGRWYLGGSRRSTARLEIQYGKFEPVLWQLGDESWDPLADALLNNQLDQAIEVLFTDDGGDLRAISSSPRQNIYMTWRFTREPDSGFR